MSDDRSSELTRPWENWLDRMHYAQLGARPPAEDPHWLKIEIPPSPSRFIQDELSDALVSDTTRHILETFGHAASSPFRSLGSLASHGYDSASDSLSKLADEYYPSTINSPELEASMKRSRDDYRITNSGAPDEGRRADVMRMMLAHKMTER